MQIKKKYYLFIPLVVVLCYVIYNLKLQKIEYSNYICECRLAKDMHSDLIFDLYFTKRQINNMSIKINKIKKPIDVRNIRKTTKNYEYKYEYGFELHDSLTVSIDDRLYKIYGFKYDTIIINRKKGLECLFKGAYLNNKWVEGNYFILK